MKHSKRQIRHLLALTLAVVVSSPAALGEEEDPFRLGGSCAALAYTTTGDLVDLLNETYADDFGSFCVPEEPMECSDYSTFLKGRGRLITGEDGYHCTLQLGK